MLWRYAFVIIESGMDLFKRKKKNVVSMIWDGITKGFKNNVNGVLQSGEIQ